MSQNPDADKFIAFLKTLSAIPILILLGLFTLPTAFYTVDTNENGVVMRFGKYNRTVGPGLHFKWPFDLESVRKVPVLTNLKMEFGFKTLEAGRRTSYDKKSYNDVSIMLTGDLNLVDVSWVIQYEIKDARAYLFNVRSVTDNLSDLSQSVMREIIGDRTVNESISEARDEIANLAMESMQKIIDKYNMGIRLVAVELQDVIVPEQVKASFDEVNSAVQDAKQTANLAKKNREKMLQEETGKAEQELKSAEAYKIELINRADGDAKRFLSLYEEYRKAPAITRTRLYLDTVTRYLNRLDKLYLMDEKSNSPLPLFNLNGGQKS